MATNEQNRKQWGSCCDEAFLSDRITAFVTDKWVCIMHKEVLSYAWLYHMCDLEV